MKRTHLTALAAILVSLASATNALAQTPYSTPMRDVENPDRSPFMLSGSSSIPTGYANTFITLPTPVGKRYFVDNASVTCTTPSTADVITVAYVTVVQNTSSTSSAGYAFPISLERRGAAAFGGLLWIGSVTGLRLYADPALASTTGGNNIYFNVFHSDGSVAASCSGTVAGHTITP